MRTPIDSRARPERSLRQTGGWYCDFRSADETFVVFAGRTIRYPAAISQAELPQSTTDDPSKYTRLNWTGRISAQIYRSRAASFCAEDPTGEWCTQRAICADLRGDNEASAVLDRGGRRRRVTSTMGGGGRPDTSPVAVGGPRLRG